MVKMAAVTQQPHASDPSRVLHGINQALCGTLKDQYVTGAYVVIDTTARIVRYAGAGHPAILILRPDRNEVEDIEMNGLILGVFSEAEYKNIEVDMSENDTLVMYTDGITEAENHSGEMFGMERLKQCILESNNASPKETSNAILAGLESWTNGKSITGPEDDITLIVTKYESNHAVTDEPIRL
jgi:serine phosphatase RsbU (regulator of sigma subunit)